MRASRLVSLLLLLQTRGRMTAAQLAEALEVSVRTIYRDLEALSAAGVPVYAEPGPNGGCQLVDGYRTRLTGLTAREAQALFAAGVPGPAGDLGLGTVLAAAQLKLLAALPEDLAGPAAAARERFHLDAPAWFHTRRAEPHLAPLAAAVWDDQRVAVRYRHTRDEEPARRELDPLGLVLKAGVWYLVARRDGQLRTYRVSRIEDVTRLDEPFERPADFELAAFWQSTVTEYESSLPAVEVVVRASPDALRQLSRPRPEVGRALRRRLGPDRGWERCVITFEDLEEAYLDLLPLGPEVEVLEPPELRARVAATAEGMSALYRDEGGQAGASGSRSRAQELMQ